MKILVTGGTGFLGTHVRRFFTADDFSRRSGFDLLNSLDTHRAGEYDVVIHLAALLDKSPEAADEVFLTNVEGTINLLRAMSPGSVFIFASTKDVYGRFADNYQEVAETCPTVYSGQSALEWSKLIAERYVEYFASKRNFRSCVFRLSTVYAPPTEGTTPNFVSHYADAINKGETIRLAARGAPRRDLLHVDDFSRCCNAFIDSVINHGLYNLGGGRENALTLRQIVGRLEDVSGLQAITSDDDSGINPVPMNYVTDLSLVKRELDWSPTINLDAGLASLFGKHSGLAGAAAVIPELPAPE
jgi:nucleoside-diphosphate-sugar epimerase